MRARWRATAERMLVYENLASSLARLRGFHLGRVLPHEDHHHANEREGLLAKSETSRPVAHAEAGSWRRGSIQAAEATLWGAFSAVAPRGVVNGDRAFQQAEVPSRRSRRRTATRRRNETPGRRLSLRAP